MISEEEKLAVVKMFCAYCRRTLRNARTDIIRKQAREARWETVFSDMHESELTAIWTSSARTPSSMSLGASSTGSIP